MSDWSFIDKFGKATAKSAGITPSSFWLAAMTGCVSGAPAEDTKYSFIDEKMEGSGEGLKYWVINHPKQVATLLACIATPPAAVTICPAVVGALGGGPLGIAAGSILAAVQTAIGPVAAGSAFAILQSAGAGGSGLIVVKTIAASGTLATTCSAAAVSFLDAMKEDQCRKAQYE